MRQRMGAMAACAWVLLAGLAGAPARAEVVDDRIAAAAPGPGSVVLFARASSC